MLKVKIKPGNPILPRAAFSREKQPDGADFDTLYRTHVERVYRYAYSRIGDIQAAEDVTAQTFLAALESFSNLRNREYFPAWLFGIARNKIMDHFRANQNTLNLEGEDWPAWEADPAMLIIQTDQVKQLAGLLAALGEEELELLRLRFLAQLSFSEMARLLGRNEDAVKKSVYRLLARLQSQAEGHHA